MEGFRDFFLQLAASHINAPLAPIARDFLLDRFDQFVSRRKPPDHPPYSAMIESAIVALNETRGSSESSISQHLEKSYAFLPVAHAELLKNHLEELCESGDIILNRWKRYKFVGEDRNHPAIGAKVSRKKFQGMKKNKQHRFKKLSVRKDGVKCTNRKKSDGEDTENEFGVEKNVKRKEEEDEEEESKISDSQQITEPFMICSKFENENSTSETPPEQVKPTPEDELCESKSLSETPVKQSSPWDDLDDEPYASEEALRAPAKIIHKYSRRRRKTQEPSSTSTTLC